MSSNTILLITGATAGLGLETIKSLSRLSKPYIILLGGRNLDKAKAIAREVKEEFPSNSNVIEPIQVDIEDDGSITKAFQHVSAKYGYLDVLLSNAGAKFDGDSLKGKMTTREMWNKSWDVNVTGTYIMTHTFIPLLLKSQEPRLIFITSGTSTMAESSNTALAVNRSPAKGWPKQEFSVPAYRSAKAGMNMMMREFTCMLKEDEVKVWCISPGFLATGLGTGDPEALKKMGAVNPLIGADFVRSVVEGARDGEVGKVIRKDDVQPW
ncbi:NAD(P)-binding protein [Tothia fuscella]|uniref:NAD(P)-binding protein n=1 Tax=Tothia fuscella TaxID=1048955 RepID=A0A9P4NIG9_9PEZI|nr:NAD(P)-binding protein [Tothia fuscella]